MSDKPKIPVLRCQDCGEPVYLEYDCNDCECGAAWVRQWEATNGEGGKVELWTFVSVGKPTRRRKNGN